MSQKRNSDKKNGLFLPMRQVTAYTSLALSLLGVVFMAGYFFGKQYVVDQFVERAERDSFIDYISASLCSVYDQKSLAHEVIPEKETLLVESTFESQDPCEYYAQLIGYNTRKAADAFAQKLVQNGVSARVKVRKSETAGGKEVVWYQVVTEPYADKNALEQLTQQIAKSEKIQGIQIVSC